jgi:hypothetical protein
MLKSSLLKGVGTYVCGQGLGCSFLDMDSPSNPPIEDEAMTLFIIYKGNITSL